MLNHIGTGNTYHITHQNVVLEYDESNPIAIIICKNLKLKFWKIVERKSEKKKVNKYIEQIDKE